MRKFKLLFVAALALVVGLAFAACTKKNDDKPITALLITHTGGLNNNTISVNINSTVTFGVTITPSDAKPATYTWEITGNMNNGIVTLNSQQNQFTGVSKGTVTAKVVAGAVSSQTVTINVIDPNDNNGGIDIPPPQVGARIEPTTERDTSFTINSSGTNVITTVAQFMQFVYRVNEGTVFSSATFELGANIDLGNEPMFNESLITGNFRGTFDGKGYTISGYRVGNLRVTNPSGQYGVEYAPAGMFRLLGAGGVIRNLNFTDFNVSFIGSTGSPTGQNGVLVNYLGAGDAGGATVQNVYLEGDATGGAGEAMESPWNWNGIVAGVTDGPSTIDKCVIDVVRTGAVMAVTAIVWGDSNTMSNIFIIYNSIPVDENDDPLGSGDWAVWDGNTEHAEWFLHPTFVNTVAVLRSGLAGQTFAALDIANSLWSRDGNNVPKLSPA
ncbi:MAG: hypothetical protein FWH03_08845 [Firmicutes bacterium]|nr:hypothetical protein [Bacillota bacterium]